MNKNAQIRYIALDKCFRNAGRMYFIEDLLEACNVALKEYNHEEAGIQQRQLFDDIRFMESEQGWSIELDKLHHGKRKYYRYSDPDFSINKKPLTDMELEQMRSALLVMSKFKGMPQFEWVNEIIAKLEQQFGLNERSKEIMGFDANIDLKGIEWIDTLFKKILYKQTIKITYQSFKRQEPKQIEVHPYYLKQYNKRWFLFGKDSSTVHPFSNFALDRIQSIEDSSEPYHPIDFDFETYFEDIIGVSYPENGKIEKVLLKFIYPQSMYILTKPLHGTQKIKEKHENYVIISIEVVSNFELEQLLLSFSGNVEVLEPITLREKILLRLQEGVERNKLD